MASNYTPLAAEMWLDDVQDFVIEKTVRTSVATNEQISDKTVHSPYVSNAVADTTTDGTYTADGSTATDESFTVSTQIISTEKIKSSDAMASHYGLNTLTTKNHGSALARREDQMMFAALSSTLTNTVNDGLLASASNGGGTKAIIASSSNIEETLDLGLQLAYEADMDVDADVVTVMDFKTASKLKQFMTSTGNAVADSALVSGFGYFGKTYNGISVYTSNLIEQEAVLSLVTQPTADDTITVNGIVFTFVASPAVAGDVDLGSDVDATRANLAAAITSGAGAGTAYIAVSSANAKNLRQRFVKATNDDTANTLTVKSYGALTVAKALTDGTDAFGDVVKLIPVFKRGIVHNYRVLSAGADVLGGAYTISNGIALANKTIGGFTGVEQEVNELFGSKIWNNSKGFGAILRIKA